MTKRIEYIDAMRGFTMILVVIAHVIFFSYQGIDVFNWGKFFKIFRMPLFFFISGYIMYKASRIWSGEVTWDFLKKSSRCRLFRPLSFCPYLLISIILTFMVLSFTRRKGDTGSPWLCSYISSYSQPFQCSVPNCVARMGREKVTSFCWHYP